MKKVLIACEESQAVCIEFRKLGFEAYSCDLQDCSGGHPEWHIKGDILKFLTPRDSGYGKKDGINFTTCDGSYHIIGAQWDMMIAHPPCTRLTNAGVRWLKEPPKDKTLVEIWREFFEGVELYKALRNAPIQKIAIENPIMHCHAKEALGIIKRNVVQPWWFGDKLFKATGFELIGLDPLVESDKSLRAIVPKPGTQEHKEWSVIHRMSPGQERAKLRSKTWPGIAKAIAEQWGAQL